MKDSGDNIKIKAKGSSLQLTILKSYFIDFFSMGPEINYPYLSFLQSF